MRRVLELCEGLPIKTVMAGETLMTQNGTKLHMAVLREGQVEVIKDESQIAVVDEPGSIFGEIAVILRTDHTATVRATKDSEFFMIEDPVAFLWERAEFNFELLNLLATRLIEVDQELADMKHQAETKTEALKMLEQMIGKALETKE